MKEFSTWSTSVVTELSHKLGLNGTTVVKRSESDSVMNAGGFRKT